MQQQINYLEENMLPIKWQMVCLIFLETHHLIDEELRTRQNLHKLHLTITNLRR